MESQLIHKHYMSFIDGSLDYDCTSCPDNCCKGFGFGGMDDGPITDLIDNNPELLPWVQTRKNSYLLLGTPISGCYYLEPGGLCRIELTHGRKAKPGVCLLFPFNNLIKLDDYVIVRPHFLCSQLKPVVPPRSGSVIGSYLKVEEDLIMTGMVKSAVKKIVIHAKQEATAILDVEKEFRDACEKSLGIGKVKNTLLNFSEDAGKLTDFIERALKILGVNRRPANFHPEAFEDLMHILLPIKRFDYLKLTREGRLRAMLLASELARSSFNMAMMPTLSHLSSYFDTVSSLLTILGFGEELFEPLNNWQADNKRLPLDSADQKIAFGSMILLTAKGYGTMQALEEALSTVKRPLERVLFIRRLAAMLEQNTSPVINTKEK